MEDEKKTISTIVEDKVYLSGMYPIEHNLDKIKKLGITHVISLTDFDGPTVVEVAHFGKNNVYHISEEDWIETDLHKYFPSTNRFIEECIDKKGKVLIHCMEGVSRSPTIAIAFVMKYFKMTFKDALAFVKWKRRIINPNIAFVSQLDKFETDIFECQDVVTPVSTIPSII